MFSGPASKKPCSVELSFCRLLSRAPNFDVSGELRLDEAVRIAEAAGQTTLSYFQRDNYQVERKSDDSPVTQADRAAEQQMRERILAAFPDDGVLGEEFGEQTGTSGYRWVLDPIDGTKSFITGVPLYSVLIGVLRERESLLGVIHIPALDETRAGCGLPPCLFHQAPDPRPA